jgi:hypothetical protein
MDVLTVEQVRNDLTDLTKELSIFADTLLIRDPVQVFIDRIKTDIRILDAYIHGEQQEQPKVKKYRGPLSSILNRF